ncbi:PAAR domain-containing protein [Acinetobacter towneri]|uniref:PAAR domain-containing protein n=1 Tax=Acinetobacter towneri TaxID=202956 RepID=UPI00336C0D7D
MGDKLSCGAIIQPQQSHVVGDSSSASCHVVSNPQASQDQLVNAQQNLINHSANKRQYENYYIECNKTDYVKFKTGIPPYDEDNKGLLGTILQIVSGTCDFFVTYILKDKNLFITVSYLPPVVKHEANKIIPYATLRLYKEKNRKSELLIRQELKSDGGVWSTERGKEPVGFCNVALPDPDLLPLKVELDLGYVLMFNGGTVTPIPSFTTYTFTLNSAAREVR